MLHQKKHWVTELIKNQDLHYTAYMGLPIETYTQTEGKVKKKDISL